MNPYAPPEATVQDQPSKPGSAFKAITLGLATDIGGTLLATIVLALIYGVALGAAGIKGDEIAATIRASATDSWFFYATTLVGLGFSVLGGFVSASPGARSSSSAPSSPRCPQSAASPLPATSSSSSARC